MKPLTLEETALKEEMKERCLAKGQYIDEKAKDKFKMLCHLEDFEVQYWKLQQENKQLKDNWNIIKQEMLKIRQSTFSKYNSNEWENCLSFNDDIKPILDKMQELEQGSDSNE